MNTIRFKYVIPQVFASREQQDSEVWQQDVLFERGKVYLVEAESGKGKSTFCSYVVGYRHDYSGQVLFDERDTHQPSLSGTAALSRTDSHGEHRD